MRPPSFPFYVNNWLASSRVNSMSPEQEGAYIRLMCYQWNSEEQAIPADDSDLAILSRMGSDWAAKGERVKRCFEPLPDKPGFLRNERLYLCWLEVSRFHELQRQKGIASGSARRRSAAAKPKLNRGSTAVEPELNLESESESDTDIEYKKEYSLCPESEQKPPLRTPLPPHKRITWNPLTRNFDGITPDDLQRWTSAFPAVDIDAELKRAALWVDSNKARGRKKNYFKFLTNWLSRAQEGGGRLRYQSRYREDGYVTGTDGVTRMRLEV